MAEVLDRLRVPGFLRLRLELRGDWLHIAVRDGSPRLLRLVTARDPEAEGGRGLWLVEQLGRAR